MSPRSDDELDVLLSRGKLGGSQRARILGAALDASRAGLWARWRARLAWTAAGLTLATGAAVLLLIVRAPQDGFQAKGRADAPLITVACLGGQVTACPPGAKVAFALEGGRDKGGFLTSYADPVGPGERVWYLTNEAVGAAPGDSSPRVIRKAAVVGGGQPAGRYRVHALFSRAPVAREALSSLPAAELLARTDLELVVRP
jgi:hypothetical protein